MRRLAATGGSQAMQPMSADREACVRRPQRKTSLGSIMDSSMQFLLVCQQSQMIALRSQCLKTGSHVAQTLASG